MPIDRKHWSHKFNGPGLRHEIAVSTCESKCVWVNGPFEPGADQDKGNFASGLMSKIAPNKKLNADRNHNSSEPGMQVLATPNLMDPKELCRFKSRARLRHETFNSRLKCYKCLSEKFRHGIDKHKIAFEAVCVIVQYQMDNGSELYAV